MVSRRVLCRLVLTFFGLTPKYRAKLFKDIHDIVTKSYHGGNSGYSWYEVYNFPIWLRNLTYRFIVEDQKESKPKEDNNDLDLSNPDTSKIPKQFLNKKNKPIKPPDYMTKVSKK